MSNAQSLAETIIANVERVIVGKRRAVEMAVITLISQGHLLIEDAPGVGKTMLVRSLAKSLNCTFKRIQFTPDMLPGDITGVSIFNQKTKTFEFHPGPIMTQLVLADEINRATPKVQSALLECMEERHITIDGTTHVLPSPFHILATQNPIEYEGTFPLPETQLDRFMSRIHMGYPSLSEEKSIIERQQYIHPIEEIKPVAKASDLIMLQDLVKHIHVSDFVKEYIVSLVQATRHHPLIYLGCSPRGALALFRAAQSMALIRGRDFAIPDDIKMLAESVLAHRMILVSSAETQEKGAKSKVIAQLLESTPVPGAAAR